MSCPRGFGSVVSGLEEKCRGQASNSRINFVIPSGQIMFSNEGSSEPFCLEYRNQL